MTEKNFQEAFDLLCATGGKGDKLTFDSIKQWFKQAGVIGMELGITDSEVQSAFEKAAKDQKEADFSQVKELLTTLGNEKKIDPTELMEKLASTSPPKTTQGADPGAKVGKGTM
ncbi:uncharacterized protein NPIL_501211 [Nephila pilipes]|uniref:Uncharacterized protein n=1 Tax=Nephila pilipes TaxID=299642 RepID=A0A8X6QI01_NEPPI|nr:uncharacterized protein NPIL_501211 [Nephila pilipes]